MISDHRHAFKKAGAAHALMLVVLLCVTGNGCKTLPPTAEDRAEAAYLFRFSEFVEWPQKSFPTPQSPLVIGVLGGNPFGDELNRLAAGRNVNGHPVVIRRLTPLSDLKNCHIVFVNRSVQFRLPLIFYSAAGGNVLLVSDAPGFVQAGGMVGFFRENGKIRFEINRPAMENAGLKINSQLLIMAKHPQGGAGAAKPH